jgi:FkbM family methyltransferase
MIIQKIKKIVLKVINKLGYHLSAIDHFPNEKAYARPSKYEDLKYYETPIGKYYLPKTSSNDVIAKCMRNGVLFDEVIINTAKRYIKEDTGVVDIGSNYGRMTIEFSKYIGQNGKVYSFEAQKSVYDILIKNVEANCPSRVQTYYNAEYETDKRVMKFPIPDFRKTETLGSFGLNPQIDEGIDVTTITIDSLNIKQPISFINAIYKEVTCLL